MTVKEFSSGFDVLLNSFFIKNQFGNSGSYVTPILDEYEKSLFLTEAQDIVLKQYLYSQEQTDNSKLQLDLSPLITVAEPILSTNTNIIKYDKRSYTYLMPENIIFVLNEKVYDADDNPYVVVPLNYKEYDRLALLPYASPLKKQVWRLYQYNQIVNFLSELIPASNIVLSKYVIRYIKSPEPIILVDLTLQDLSINNKKAISTSKLSESLHYDILHKAVELAYSRNGGVSNLLNQTKEEPSNNKEE